MTATVELKARRDLLRTSPNPDARLDYVVTLGGRVAWIGSQAQVRIRYVPDRAVIEPASFALYLDEFSRAPAMRIEAFAVAMLTDLNDQLVPRWVEVAVAAAPGGAGEHRVMIADRQPKWDNPGLLRRLVCD